MSILPNFTQRIDTLVSKVNSLEALLAERTSQLNVTTEECQLLREQINKRTDLLTESLNSLSSTSRQYEILREQFDKIHKIYTKLPALEKSISCVTVDANDKNIHTIDHNFHTNTGCGMASHIETNTELDQHLSLHACALRPF